MVLKASLICYLLKAENQNGGLSFTEIIKRLSEIYNITPDESLKNQVNVALKRGIDFGILIKKNQKYIYDSYSNDSLNEPEQKAKRHKKAAKKSKKTRKKSSPRSKPSRRKRSPSFSRKQSYNPPLPRVPPPPNWTPKRRNIREESIPKLIKHRGHSPCLL